MAVKEFDWANERCIIKYEDTPETREKLTKRLLEFFFYTHAFSGESIYQSDMPQLEAPELLADIADNIFKFDCKWEEK